MSQSNKQVIEIKPYLSKDLLRFYQVTYPTLNKWLDGIKDKIGKRNGAYWSSKQVEIIFQELGVPKTISY